MLFHFFKYIQPTHYFLLKPKDRHSVFPDIKDLPQMMVNELSSKNYRTKVGENYDVSWQAIEKGYISKKNGIETLERVSIDDEYIFLGKYYSKIWSLYVLILRILTLKNPIKEIKGFMNAWKLKKLNLSQNPINHKNWLIYKSELLIKRPNVSVIIPTLNRYKYLKNALIDLENQDYKNFEVIIVDQSDNFDEEFYKVFNIKIILIRQSEKALWLARNTAILKSDASLILLFDDDSRVSPDWITNHIKCLDFFKADISSGVSISKVGGAVPAHYSHFKISDQLDTGNALIKKEVFKKIGLFDRQFEKQRMGDGEFGLRAYLFGLLNVSNPYANRLHLKVNVGGLREMGSWDAFRTKGWSSPRPVPSVLYFYRRYFDHKSVVLSLLKNLPTSIIPYQFKKKKYLLVIGVIISILLIPLIIYQLALSWRLATIKLKEGPLINYLE